MNNSDTTPTKYKLLTLGRDKRELDDGHYAGVALKYEGEDYYVLKVSMFSRQSFYLSRDKHSEDRYSVFSRKVQKDTGVRLQNRVGVARLFQSTKSYLEIVFDLLDRSIFLDLYPINSN